MHSRSVCLCRARCGTRWAKLLLSLPLRQTVRCLYAVLAKSSNKSLQILSLRSLLASMDLAKAYDFAEPMAGIIMLRWHKRHTSHGCERCAMIRPQWKEVASALGDQLDAECCGKEDIRLFWLPSAARFAGCLAHFCTFFAMYFCFVFCFHGLESYGQWWTNRSVASKP